MNSALAAVTASSDFNSTLLYFYTGTGSNFTEENVIPSIPNYIRTTAMVLCLLILGVGVVGNVMVPLVILKSKDMRNSTNIFLLNLSVADLMVLLVCTPTVFVEVNSQPETWVLGREMCKAVPFVEMTVAHASVLTILAISFERYYAICEPLKAGYVCTKARALLICLLAWAFAAIFTSPVLSIADYRYEKYFDGSIVPICLTEVDTFGPAFFFIFTICMFFIIPLVILVILYTIIARHLMIHPGIISHNNNNSSAGNALRYRKQVVLMLGTVVLSFFVCLLPFRALTLWIIISPPEAVVDLGIHCYYSILYFCRIMHYLNSAINPILYNLMSSKFRDGFMKLCGIKKKSTFRDFLGRKGTFNTTSTTATTTTGSGNLVNRSPTESFWRRSIKSQNNSIKLLDVYEDIVPSRNQSTRSVDSSSKLHSRNSKCQVIRSSAANNITNGNENGIGRFCVIRNDDESYV